MRSMKLLLIASLVMAFACVSCSTNADPTIGEEAASGEQEVQIIKLPSDQQELRESNKSRLHQNFPTVSFALRNSNARSYNAFILNLRNALKGPDVKFNFPMMRNPNVITNSNRFLLVKLSNNAGRLSTELAVRVSDGYVVGFCCGKYDERAKKDTAWFFTPENAADREHNRLLFTGDKVSHNYLGYKGNYDSLGNREIPLGPVQMDASIATLANTEKGRDTAKNSLLVLLQMVAEATRYQYISDKVAASITNYQSFTPDPLMISYENNWGTLSTGVATAVGEGVFRNQVELKDKNGRVIKTVGYVWQLRNELSLLTFVRT